MTVLKDVADIRLGTQLQSRITDGIRLPYLRAANVQRGFLDLKNVKTMFVTKEQAERLQLIGGDLLFVEGNSLEEVGRVAAWHGDNPTIIQNALIRVRLATDRLDRDFVMLWFNTSAGNGYIRRHATTTSGSLWHIGAGKLANAPIPLPPINVQRQIVAAHRQTLQRAGEAKRKSAALTRAAWDRFGSHLIHEPAAAATAGMVTVTRFSALDRWDTDVTPVGTTSPYPLVRLDAVADVRLGVQLQRSNTGGQDVPYLRVANVQRGYLDLAHVKTMNVSADTVARLALERHDLLFLEANSLEEVGRCARWDGQIPLCIHQNHVIRARLVTSDLLPEYVEAWFNSPPGGSHVRARARTTSGTLYTIPVSVLATAPVPVPPIGDQARLIADLREGLAEAHAALIDAGRLRKQAETDLISALSSSP
ncbi:restriction endonuclease subunit S [Micromonospora sp. D93]|uniref:restriction endonuclease subunit S n=1 Tax=Micromonospora sp. D93 TaxID=2824886 RepID=UPI001B38D2DB|nr:restriction endonuclease subunit S [Micromonospora sp. D93]MBQ1019832.1 restriction endonuclease subunit S [Micromonospora sp. D93]